MIAITPGQKFKTREAPAPIPAADAEEGVTLGVAATPEAWDSLEEAIREVVVIREGALDLMAEAGAKLRMTRGWKT
jgi:hypothetical protein